MPKTLQTFFDELYAEYADLYTRGQNYNLTGQAEIKWRYSALVRLAQTGEVKARGSFVHDVPETPQTCTECDGEGLTGGKTQQANDIEWTCARCDGTGVEPERDLEAARGQKHVVMYTIASDSCRRRDDHDGLAIGETVYLDEDQTPRKRFNAKWYLTEDNRRVLVYDDRLFEVPET